MAPQVLNNFRIDMALCMQRPLSNLFPPRVGGGMSFHEQFLPISSIAPICHE